MKVKRANMGSSQNVGSSFYGRETVSRSEDEAYKHEVTNDYGKEPMKETPEREGIRVYPSRYGPF